MVRECLTLNTMMQKRKRIEVVESKPPGTENHPEPKYWKN